VAVSIFIVFRSGGALPSPLPVVQARCLWAEATVPERASSLY